MKKIIITMFALLVMAASIPVKAQQLIGKLDYSAGNLAGQNGWTVAASERTSSPIQVTNETLSHPTGYGAGEKVIDLPYASTTTERLFKAIPEQTSGEIWYSLLLRVDNHRNNSYSPLVSLWTGDVTFADASATGNAYNAASYGGGLGIKTIRRTSVGDTVFQLAATTCGNTNFNSTYPSLKDTFNIHQTYLVVVKYKFFAGDNNDSIYWWIDPSASDITTNTAPAAQYSYHQATTTAPAADITSFKSFLLMRYCVNSSISALRVANSWAGLFGLSAPTDQPALSIAPTAINIDTIWQDSTYTGKVVITGENLSTAALTASESTDHADLLIDKTTLDKSKVESTDGDTLTFTIKAVTIGENQSATITYSGGGIESPILQTITWNAYKKPEPVVIPSDTVNMLLNYDFEEWEGGGIGGENPVDWETTMGGREKSTAQKVSGTYSAKLYNTGPTKNILEQEVSRALYGGFTKDDTFELVLNYYVETSQGGNDIQMTSYWHGTAQAGDILSHDAAILSPSGYFPASQGTWVEKKVYTTAPADAVSFYLRLNVTKNSAVYFDNFSFKKVKNAVIPETPQPELSVTLTSKVPDTIWIDSTYTGKIVVKGSNLSTEALTAADGDDHDDLTIDKTTLDKTKIESADGDTLTFTVNAVFVGIQNKTITFSGGGISEPITQNIKWRGVKKSLPATPVDSGSLTVNTDGLSTFGTIVGTPVKDTIYYTSEGLLDWGSVIVRNTSGTAFSSNGSMLVKDGSNIPVIITYNPTAAGSHSATITFKAKGVDSVNVLVTGTATGGETTITYDTVFNFNKSYAVKHLREDFETGLVRNQQLSLPHWQNVVVQGERPWWGFNWGDSAHAAKATAYIFGQEEKDPYEMWMCTPLLDAVNSETKMLTFAIRRDFVPEEGAPAELQVVYMDIKSDTSFDGTIIPVTMPSTVEENETWFDYQINIEDFIENVADTFCIGFRFIGESGAENPAVFYVDDVSFGEHIPYIKVSEDIVLIDAREHIDSAKISIHTADLTDDILLELTGTNADRFELSNSSFPASTTDTSFVVTYISPLSGSPLSGQKEIVTDTHYAAVLVSSTGAADGLVFVVGISERENVSVEVVKESSSLNLWQKNDMLYFKADGMLSYKIISATGASVLQGAAGKGSVNAGRLAKGVYLLQVNTSKGVLNKKFIR